MPIIKSAKKQLKLNKKNKAKNDFFKSIYKESKKAFELAIKENDLAKAKELFENKRDESWKNIKSWLQAIIDKLVKKNIIHQKNGSRKKANFVKMMKKLS